jgi:uncharacterized protein (TIGR02099 family)
LTIFRHRLRRVRLWLFALLALLVIVMGCLVGLTQLALPWVASHPEWISGKLSEALHRPVTIDRVATSWERNGPLIDLSGLHLAAATAVGKPMTIASAGIKINFFAWARHNASWTEFRITGIEIDLQRDAGGSWHLNGMDSGGDNAVGESSSLDDNPVFGLGTVVLRNARLTIDDVPNNQHLKFGSDELRLINKGDLHRVLAHVTCLQTNSPPLNVVIEYNSDDHTGRAFLGGQNLDLAALLHAYPVKGLTIDRGKGSVQVWAWFADMQISQARAEIELSDIGLTTQTAIALDDKRDIAPHIGVDRLSFGARWQVESDGWSADLADLAITRQGVAATPAQAHLRKRNAAIAVLPVDGATEAVTAAAEGAAVDAVPATTPEYSVAVQTLDLSTFASVAMLIDAPTPPLRRWLYSGNPEGIVARGNLRFVDAQNYDLAVQLDGLGWHAVDKLPGINGLSAHVLADQSALNIDLPQHNAFALALPHVFRQALDFSEFSGSIAAYRAGSVWRIETDALEFDGATPGKSYGGQLRGGIELPDDGARPNLEAYALISHAEVPAAHLFWPIGPMSPSAIAWMDRALDGGHIANARAAFRGNLADWPFRTNTGRFDAQVEVSDLRFKYLGDWPVFERGHALANFVNAGLHVDVDAGSVIGNAVNKASVDITDYGEGTLDVAANAQGSGRDLLGFVKASPLGTRFAAPLQGIDVTGQGKVDFTVHAPMKPIENFVLDGKAQLIDADMSDSKYNLQFDNANGPLRFNRSGFAADQLTTTFKDKPAKLSLSIGSYVSDAQHAFEARIETRQPIETVLDYAPVLSGYKKYTGGEANWSALFSIDRDADDKPNANSASTSRLALSSDLRGVRLDLPAPLAKSSDSALPLKLTITLPFVGADLDLRLGDILRMHGRLPTPTAPFAALVDFGGEASAALPQSGMVISGSAAAVDLSGWMDFATAGSGDGGDNILNRVDVHARSLSAWDHTLGAHDLKLATTADAIEIGFDGANIEGALTIPRKDIRQRGITADFKRLYWPESPDPEPGAPEEADETSSLNPTAVPPLHLRIGDFHLGKANYGQASMESQPVADGMHFEQVTTHSANIDMKAHGDWFARGGHQRSTFGIDLTAQNLGHMLDALGSPGFLEGGQTVAHIDASWAGSPAQFAINKINGGALKLKIDQGSIPEIEAGAGRLAGLLNLAAIPRRLAFDFGDLFKKGYSFDSIAGTFTLHDGYAYTDNLEVKSPTADMRLKGSVGLKTRDWDQVVEVTPHVGGTLLVGGGALIGGPVGAAAGVLLQTMFKNQINAATRFDYKVTGSWDKPSVVRVATTSVNQKKAPANPGGPSK